MANEKTKKEHYVPRCYLKRWGNSNNQVLVYDKKQNNEWTSNVYDVACEKYFYDIDASELNKTALDFLNENGINPEDDKQFVEHFFSENVETGYGLLLQDIIDKEISQWQEKNCFFINIENKKKLSFYFAYQYLRTKAVRQTISSFSDCINKLLVDLNCSNEIKNRYSKKPGDESIIQCSMICNDDYVNSIAERLFDFSWILRINKTKKDFWTSDNPIGTKPHVYNKYISTSGILNDGIEVYIPLSPRYLLTMFDGKYHVGLKKYDRRYIEIDNEEDVYIYNRLLLHNSEQYIYMKENDIDEIRKLILKDSNILKLPKISMTYNGKKYTP